MQTGIPSVLMRGGTSKGLYFRKEDLPADKDAVDRVLLAAYGSPDPRQIDGVGGATTLTSKAVIVSPSEEPDVDVDYLFAQVTVDRPFVDYGPTCGNMLAGVGPFAIESGLVPAEDGETRVRIRQVNTGGLVEAVVQTPGGRVNYEGDSAIDGVPGTAAPVVLNFSNVVGSKTGALFPSGHAREEIDGIQVTLVDAAMPVMALHASAAGISGYESAAELDANKELFARLEGLRLEAGRRMGLGDVTGKVMPKIDLVAPPRNGGTFASRYLVPTRTHEAHAVTGAIAMSAAAVVPGTVVNDVAEGVEGDAPRITIEHPTGTIDLALKLRRDGDSVEIETAGVVRTARLLFSGNVLVPDHALTA